MGNNLVKSTSLEKIVVCSAKLLKRAYSCHAVAVESASYNQNPIQQQNGCNCRVKQFIGKPYASKRKKKAANASSRAVSIFLWDNAAD